MPKCLVIQRGLPLYKSWWSAKPAFVETWSMRLALAQATISQHLKELKQAELIQGEVEGTSVCYCINTKKWNELKTMFSCLFGSLKKGKFKCC